MKQHEDLSCIPFCLCSTYTIVVAQGAFHVSLVHLVLSGGGEGEVPSWRKGRGQGQECRMGGKGKGKGKAALSVSIAFLFSPS